MSVTALSIRLDGMMLAPDGFLLNMGRQAFDEESSCTLRKGLLGDLAGIMRLFRSDGSDAPPVLLVAASEESLALLFLEAQPKSPSEFEVLDDGLSWSLQRSTIKGIAPGELDAYPWPFLVTLGYHPQRRTLVLGNLGQIGSLTFAGDRPPVLGKLESIAYELANSPFVKDLRVVCLGFGRSLAKKETVTVAPRLQTALRMHQLGNLPDPANSFNVDSVNPVCSEVAGGLNAEVAGESTARGAASLASGFAGQLRALGENICVLALDPHPQDRELLERLYDQGALRLVVIGESGLQYEKLDLSVNGDAWNGSGVGAFSVSDDLLRWETTALELRRTDSLLSGGSDIPAPSRRGVRFLDGDSSENGGDVSLSAGESPADACPDAEVNVIEAPSVEIAAPPGTQPGAVDLRVLGIVQVSGLQNSVSSARTLALICYLAFHPNGATVHELEHWLWGRGAPPGARALSNAVHRARVALGRNSEDDLYLPYFTSNGAYGLSKEVTSDLERFKRWVKAADGSDGCEAALRYKEALSLVRGVPFGGGEKGDLYAWADISLRNHAEFQIDSAAHKLADLSMKLGDYDLARWSVWKGLLITPGCEQCYRRRFLIAYQTGRRSELQMAMRELKRILNEPEDSDDLKFEVSPELQELYQTLVKAL